MTDKPLPFDDYARHDALGLAELVSTGEASPEELLDAAMARADAVNPRLGALTLELYDHARSELARGLPAGPFAGVPFLVKDIGFAMRGVVSSNGSTLFRDSVTERDSTVVERYRDAGLVIFGRTASPEFGLLPTTESALFGVTRNPWNLERTPGGSSGGSAAAVAAGVVPMASASDGGGSIRIPASCCGLFGLKPTRARVPLGPDGFEAWEGLVVLHAVTRSVRDSAALLDASSGPALGDAYWAPAPARPYLEEVGALPGRLRVALALELEPGATLHPECRAAAESAARLCESLGHEVDEVTPPLPYEELRRAMGITVSTGVSMWVDIRLRQLGRGLEDGDIEPMTAKWAERAARYTASDIVWARNLYHRSSLLMAEFQRDFDVILSPTLARPPIEHGVLSLAGTDLEAHTEETIAFMPFTRIANWTGQPAMTVPLHWTSSGLPVGVMFCGRFGDEATLFRLAAQLEEARPWARKRPPIGPPR